MRICFYIDELLDFALGKPTSVMLTWDCVPGAIGYELQISTPCGYGNALFIADCGTSMSGLGYDTRYHWRVRAVGQCGVVANG